MTKTKNLSDEQILTHMYDRDQSIRDAEHDLTHASQREVIRQLGEVVGSEIARSKGGKAAAAANMAAGLKPDGSGPRELIVPKKDTDFSYALQWQQTAQETDSQLPEEYRVMSPLPDEHPARLQAEDFVQSDS